MAEYISLSMTPKEQIGRLRKEDFDGIRKVHDWRNYVDDELMERWEDVPDWIKLCIWRQAERQAESEDWD